MSVLDGRTIQIKNDIDHRGNRGSRFRLLEDKEETPPQWEQTVQHLRKKIKIEENVKQEPRRPCECLSCREAKGRRRDVDELVSMNELVSKDERSTKRNGLRLDEIAQRESHEETDSTRIDNNDRRDRVQCIG